MSYEMRWMLQVHPQGATLEWPGDSSAPKMADLLSQYGVCWSWYRMEEDMRALSARAPEVLFTLTIHNVDEAGLSPPERWYFKAGRVQKTTASYLWPDFNSDFPED